MRSCQLPLRRGCQHLTLVRAHTLQQPIKRFALATPTAQSRDAMKIGHTHSQVMEGDALHTPLIDRPLTDGRA